MLTHVESFIAPLGEPQMRQENWSAIAEAQKGTS